MVECAGFEIRYTVPPYRGFESLPLRHSARRSTGRDALRRRSPAPVGASVVPACPLGPVDVRIGDRGASAGASGSIRLVHGERGRRRRHERKDGGPSRALVRARAAVPDGDGEPNASFGHASGAMLRRSLTGRTATRSGDAALAEREGFEPSIRDKTYTPLAGERLQPLGHLSGDACHAAG